MSNGTTIYDNVTIPLDMAAVKYLVCSMDTDTPTTFPVNNTKWTQVPYMTRSCVLEKLMNRLGQEGWSNYRYDAALTDNIPSPERSGLV